MKKTECKIIQDLLPSYIDGLTSNDTNTFIEQHIENCSECEEVLKNMQGDIQLEKINNSKKINALKKVKRRYRRITVISILLVILVIIIALYLWNNYRLITNENGKITIERFTFDKSNASNYKNVIINYRYEQNNGTIDGYVYTIYILTFNRRDVCINARKKVDGYDSKELNHVYMEEKNAEKLNQTSTNVQIVGDALIYNDNNKNGKSKDELIKYFETIKDVKITEY